MTFAVSIAAQSDVGCVRSNNEDSYGYDPVRKLFAVCDGMGGLTGGEVASELAVRTLLAPHPEPSPDAPSQPKEVALFNLVLAANRAVHQAGLNNPPLRGMGTTLVAAVVDEDRLLIANVGDSRAYLIRGGGCAQLTRDHSFLEEQIRAGAITAKEAQGSAAASIITRAVGVQDSVEPDLYSLALEDDDLILLTSDGLTRYVTPQELAATIRPHRPLEETCSCLINTAKMLGAVDNITCLLLQFKLIREDPPEANRNDGHSTL